MEQISFRNGQSDGRHRSHGLSERAHSAGGGSVGAPERHLLAIVELLTLRANQISRARGPSANRASRDRPRLTTNK